MWGQIPNNLTKSEEMNRDQPPLTSGETVWCLDSLGLTASCKNKEADVLQSNVTKSQVPTMYHSRCPGHIPKLLDM